MALVKVRAKEDRDTPTHKMVKGGEYEIPEHIAKDLENESAVERIEPGQKTVEEKPKAIKRKAKTMKTTDAPTG